jgi:two-component system chemotaxis sensor kinase CheA
VDLSPYRDLFVSESRIHLSSFSELIVLLEQTPDDAAAIDELFRHAHSLKGMAGTMEFGQIADIAHVMESRLSQVRSGEYPLLPVLADLLLEACDTLSRLVDGIEASESEFEDTGGLIDRLDAFDFDAPPPSAPSRYEAVNSSAEDPASDVHQFRQTDTFKSIRIKTETLDHLVNITGELITNRYRLAESIRLAGASECREPLNQLTLLLRALRDEVFKARMLPFGMIAEPFPRLVRNLARKQSKEILFQLEGKEIELDRGILEEIAEPIVHILRNAVDHGMESAEERIISGKLPKGSILLTVSRDKDHVEIIIADDGRGMDPERLKRIALEKGVITPERFAGMTSREALQLICAPGFSTAEAVTDVSGRGVGMDAVREAVYALSGVLTIQSQYGQGSRFILRFPMTVSIIHALIVQSGPLQIAFPLNVVMRTVEFRRSEMVDESGRMTAFPEGAELQVRSLRQALNQDENRPAPNDLVSVVICHAGSPLAFTVDRIIGQQEIFIRPLRTPLSCLRGVSGATITGDGRVLFVADVAALA